MTDTIQMCGDSRRARVFLINTRPVEIPAPRVRTPEASVLLGLREVFMDLSTYHNPGSDSSPMPRDPCCLVSRTDVSIIRSEH